MKKVWKAKKRKKFFTGGDGERVVAEAEPPHTEKSGEERRRAEKRGKERRGEEQRGAEMGERGERSGKG